LCRYVAANSHMLQPVGTRDPIVVSRDDGERGEADLFGRASTPSPRAAGAGAGAGAGDFHDFYHHGGGGDGNINNGYHGNTNAHDIGGGHEDEYRPCRARVPAADWANHKTASSNPNALIADRPEVRTVGGGCTS
jgi:hypothetical protein